MFDSGYQFDRNLPDIKELFHEYIPIPAAEAALTEITVRLPLVDRGHNLAAYPADRLRGVDLLFVGLKLRTLRAIVIGAEVRLCHTSPAFGYKKTAHY